MLDAFDNIRWIALGYLALGGVLMALQSILAPDTYFGGYIPRHEGWWRCCTIRPYLAFLKIYMGSKVLLGFTSSTLSYTYYFRTGSCLIINKILLPNFIKLI